MLKINFCSLRLCLGSIGLHNLGFGDQVGPHVVFGGVSSTKLEMYVQNNACFV